MSKTLQEQLSLTISGEPLSVEQVCRVASGRYETTVNFADGLRERLDKSSALVQDAVSRNQSVYGVTTGFGGMAGVAVDGELAAASQNNLLSFLATGAGDFIDNRHVRAAMLLRANVLSRGCSGVRPEIIERLVKFIQVDAVPLVRELGSIGASGDLVPLSVIARAVTGQSPFVQVNWRGRQLSGSEILDSLDLEPISLLPKEGLAIVNGTSFSSAIAANCIGELQDLLAVTMGVQSLMLQALQVQEDPFEDFVHQQKPHPGQVWSAAIMKRLLTEDRTAVNGKPVHVQDRYSLRCLPQYMGAIVEGVARIRDVVETEMNSVSDNPLIDADQGRFYQSGNFLGQYIGIAMDDLRRFVGLMAKHLDVQIATLVAPEFSNGLPASLRGNSDVPYNMGLKGLQITGNSIMPMLTYLGNPIVEHFPTHAEQFNQNINGLSWGAANLGWKSIGLFRHHLSVSLIFAVQALDLRAKQLLGHFDGRALLGGLAVPLYEAVCAAVHVEPGANQPYLQDDADLWLEDHLASIRNALESDGVICEAVDLIRHSFAEKFCRRRDS